MVHAAQGLGLVAEPRARARRHDQRRCEHLERDHAPEALLPRAIHGAHAAAAHFLEDGEPGDDAEVTRGGPRWREERHLARVLEHAKRRRA